MRGWIIRMHQELRLTLVDSHEQSRPMVMQFVLVLNFKFQVLARSESEI
jgi:hypothetical protein